MLSSLTPTNKNNQGSKPQAVIKLETFFTPSYDQNYINYMESKGLPTIKMNWYNTN